MQVFDIIARWLSPAKDAVAPQPVPDERVASQPSFPYPLVTVHGSEAMATWTRLRATGDGYPVILGSDEDIDFIREGISEIDERTPEEILATAATLTFPGSLKATRAEEDRFAREYMREQGQPFEEEEEGGPDVGDWPEHVETTALTVHAHYTGRVYDRVHIALLPCKTGWEAIAHLRWGKWNDNPAAEHHVAALRAWHERYGAELIGCSHDVLNLRVTHRPTTRDEAVALARDQYLYCNDVVDQGVETLAVLGAVLMTSDWWYFWRD